MQAGFIVFLSKGYFRSKNCRRELYTAIELNRSIIAVLETDEQKGGASLAQMRKECAECCADRPEALQVSISISILILYICLCIYIHTHIYRREAPRSHRCGKNAQSAAPIGPKRCRRVPLRR